ncbi:MAG: MBL fold metallo-hydrolase [Xanthomonadales bacterium]|nr:MBL fold metallo-hydrolase [Xanthomonadales bacterium]
MLEGEGGNIAASVGFDGVVIVDDQYAPLAEKIRAALQGITDKPLRFVINTHYHFDHAGGNERFGGEATIVAHDNVRRRLMTGGWGGNGGAVKFESAPGVPTALPVVTFGATLTLYLNGEDIRAMHYPAAHTDGDSVVFFTRSNVVHMGDNFVTYGFPFVDRLAGGSVKGMIAACDGVIAQLPNNVTIIPGHGPVSSLADLQRYVDMLKAVYAAVEKEVKAGKSLQQLKDAKVLEPWKQYNGTFISSDAFIETLHDEFVGSAPAA